MRLVYFTTILILLLVLVVPAILAFGIHKIASGYQLPLTDTQAIYKNISVKQNFRVKNDNLSAIGLSIKNPYLRNSQDLFFKLFDGQNQQIREMRLNGKNIGDGNYMIINFDPVTASQGRDFYFTLTAPDVESLNSLEVYHSQTNIDGQYLVNNELKEGSLAFVYYFSPNSPIVNLLVIYRNLLFKLFQDLPFILFYLATIILMSIYLTKEFLKRDFR